MYIGLHAYDIEIGDVSFEGFLFLFLFLEFDETRFLIIALSISHNSSLIFAI